MRAHELRDRDARFAELFTKTTQWLKHVPSLEARIVGYSAVSDGWHRIDTPAWKYDNFWMDFPGDPHGPRLPIPSRYQMVGTAAIQRHMMIEARDTFEDSRDAIGLRFGTQVVVGALAIGKEFPIDLEDEMFLRTSARIGRDQNTMMAGVYSPTERAFVAVEAYPNSPMPIGRLAPYIPVL